MPDKPPFISSSAAAAKPVTKLVADNPAAGQTKSAVNENSSGLPEINQPSHRPLGELLLEEGLIRPEQLERALAEQRVNPTYLGVILMRHKWVDERDVFRILSRQHNLPFLEVREREIPTEVVDKMPKDVALKHSILPVEYQDGILRVAMEDPLNESLLNSIRQVIPEQLQPGFTTRSDLHYAINRAYHNLVRSNPLVRDFFDGFAYLIEQPQFDSNRLIDLILALAHLLGASDIHLIFSAYDMKVALRIDGSLHTIPIPTRRIRPEQTLQLRNALKIRSGIDPSKRAAPQDGRLELEMEHGSIQARIACMPLVDGEKMAARLIGRLDIRDFAKIGLARSEYERILTLLKRPSGLILVAGPTGSGKTTTLYAMLGKIPCATQSVVTIEDPVEARLPFAAQVQIDRERSFAFSTALRSILHQDPDVILVGEIRDRETATAVVEAAMSGYLVISSVTMDNAAGVILRLIHLGVEPLALASALNLVVAQRLAPKLCESCRTFHPESEMIPNLLNLEKAPKLYASAGCPKCYFSGRSGRVAIFETLFITDNMRDIISEKPSLTTIVRAAYTAGGRSFREDAVEKCLKGLLAPEDVLTLT